MTVERTRRPTPPGMLLQELYLRPRGITIGRFAEATELSRKHISNIIHGRAALSAETAVKFGRALGTTSKLWINLQHAVDVFDAEQKLKKWRPAVALNAAETARP